MIIVQSICKYHLHTVEYTHRPKRGAKGYVQRVSSGKRFLLCGRPAKLTGMPLEGGSGSSERLLILNWGNRNSFADISLRKQGAKEEGYKMQSKHFLISALLFSSFSLFLLQVIGRSPICFADSLWTIWDGAMLGFMAHKSTHQTWINLLLKA